MTEYPKNGVLLEGYVAVLGRGVVGHGFIEVFTGGHGSHGAREAPDPLGHFL